MRNKSDINIHQSLGLRETFIGKYRARFRRSFIGKPSKVREEDQTDRGIDREMTAVISKKKREDLLLINELETGENDGRKTAVESMIGSARNAPKLRASRKLSKEEQIKKYKDPTYDVMDLTYTLITGNLPIVLVAFVFFLLVIIRYYTLACLLYIGVKSDARHMMWLPVVIGDRILFIILVVKVSLKIPETRTEVSLKKHWNAKSSSDFSDLFEVIDLKKLAKSVLLGLVPAEFSFLYIRGQRKKSFQIFVAINYIYASIESVVFYPFFIAYTSILTIDNQFGLNAIYGHSTLGLAVLAELILLIFSIVLLVMGIRRKYVNCCFCLSSK